MEQTDKKISQMPPLQTVSGDEIVPVVKSGGNYSTLVSQIVALARQTMVEAQAGKGLSANDFTDALKAKLEGLSNYDDTQVRSLITAINGRLDTILGDGASTAIDTFNEIEAFLTGITDTQTLTGLLAEQKQTITAETDTKLAGKVDKVNGKGLSANDFTNDEKAKLEGLSNYDDSELRSLILAINERIDTAGRYWNEANSTSTAAGYYGSLEALRSLPAKLGLGRYLVTDDRKKRKLDPHDSTRYADGTPAALDGTQGQCMWCWNGFYANIWKDGNNLIKAVTFGKPVGNGVSIWVPAGGISWLGAGVMDRTNQKLCSLISDAEQYRGGGGVALNPASYAKAPGVDSPQITMLGMPATSISTTSFGNYARKRGEGWEANWFVARFVVEFLFEIIMGTENSQAAFNADKDDNGLYQGGFGTGVTDMPDWNSYNGAYPVIPTSVGLEAGDGVCLVSYKLPQTDGAEGDTYKEFKVPVFFGLVGAGFGNLFSLVRGIIMDAGEEKSLVYVTPSMYANYDPNTVADKIMVAECPQVDGYIKRKSYQGLCCIPTEVGGSATIRFADNFYANGSISKGLRVRAAGGHAFNGANAGASCTFARYEANIVLAHYSAPLCYFEEDPVIPETQKIG